MVGRMEALDLGHQMVGLKVVSALVHHRLVLVHLILQLLTKSLLETSDQLHRIEIHLDLELRFVQQELIILAPLMAVLQLVLVLIPLQEFLLGYHQEIEDAE